MKERFGAQDPHVGAAGVVEAVSESKGDLGMVPAFATSHGGAWWSAMEFESAPKIIARLPFIERADHPAALPVFVVSRVADSAMVTEVETWSVRVAGWSREAARAAAALAEIVAVPDAAFDGAALLLGEGDIEVEVEIAADRRRPREAPPHPLPVSEECRERRTRHGGERHVGGVNQKRVRGRSPAAPRGGFVRGPLG